MTVLALNTGGPLPRTARPRHYLMCRPEHFTVSYEINPWMHRDVPVDTALAVAQWEGLRRAFLDLGHTVDLIDPLPGQPDMVYAANGGATYRGRALGARFAHRERSAEGPAYLAWLRGAGLARVAEPVATNEGEGDFLPVGDRILAGTGFRTDRAAHAEAQELFGAPVISLTLVDPRWYHLDTALAVLDDDTIAWYPPAFSRGSQEVLRTMFPDAIVASDADAAVLGLNAVSDGANVVVSAAGRGLIAQLSAHGFTPVPVDLSELLKGGGGPKCCTLEIRS